MSIPWHGCCQQQAFQVAGLVTAFLSPIALILLNRISGRRRAKAESQLGFYTLDFECHVVPESDTSAESLSDQVGPGDPVQRDPGSGHTPQHPTHVHHGSCEGECGKSSPPPSLGKESAQDSAMDPFYIARCFGKKMKSDQPKESNKLSAGKGFSNLEEILKNDDEPFLEKEVSYLGDQWFDKASSEESSIHPCTSHQDIRQDTSTDDEAQPGANNSALFLHKDSKVTAGSETSPTPSSLKPCSAGPFCYQNSQTTAAKSPPHTLHSSLQTKQDEPSKSPEIDRENILTPDNSLTEEAAESLSTAPEVSEDVESKSQPQDPGGAVCTTESKRVQAVPVSAANSTTQPQVQQPQVHNTEIPSEGQEKKGAEEINESPSPEVKPSAGEIGPKKLPSNHSTVSQEQPVKSSREHSRCSSCETTSSRSSRSNSMSCSSDETASDEEEVKESFRHKANSEFSSFKRRSRSRTRSRPRMQTQSKDKRGVHLPNVGAIQEKTDGKQFASGGRQQSLSPAAILEKSLRHSKGSSDRSDISGYHKGPPLEFKYPLEEDEEETLYFTEWLCNTLKSWLPDLLSPKKENTKSQPNPENCKEFEKFDIRNVLGTGQDVLFHESETDPEIKLKTCTHSCESSLCNFRRTLESWKKELLTMHATLNTSTDYMLGQCNLCTEATHAHQLKDCHTIQIAKQFWRTVLQFKRSHLLSSECSAVGVHGKNDCAHPLLQRECAQGHKHCCATDFSGCSQFDTSSNGENGEAQMAPCVHVLLNDVDCLLKKLEELTEAPISKMFWPENASENPESKTFKTEDQSLPLEKTEELQGKTISKEIETSLKQENEPPSNESTHSESKSPPSMLLLGPYTPFPSDNPPGENHISPNDNKYQGNPFRELASSVPEGNPEKDDRPKRETLRVGDEIQQEKGTTETLLDGEHPQALTAEYHSSSELSLWRSEELALCKTRVLGRFALRYIEHIEHKLDTVELSNSPPPANVPPSKASSRTEFSKQTLSAHEIKLSSSITRPSSLSHIQNLDRLLREKCEKINQSKQNGQGGEFPEDATPRHKSDLTSCTHFTPIAPSLTTQPSPVSGTEKGSSLTREPSLVVTCRDIISELMKLQSAPLTRYKWGPLARMHSDKKGSKNVKFAVTSPRRSQSETSSRRSLTSPPMQPVVLTTSSCLSLISGEDVTGQDLSVSEAFDQLDMVVDDLLMLMKDER